MARGAVFRGRKEAPGPLQHGILVSGLLEFLAARGNGWSDYWQARDIAYGIARVDFRGILLREWQWPVGPGRVSGLPCWSTKSASVHRRRQKTIILSKPGPRDLGALLGSLSDRG